jgi:hypothetical protein
VGDTTRRPVTTPRPATPATTPPATRPVPPQRR